MKVLIVDDEIKVTSFIKRGLEEYGFEADIALTPDIAQKKLGTTKYQVIILDVNLPQMSGFELCRRIRQQDENIPILMLTALGTTDDKLAGFDAGADDYLVKPFEFGELVARLRVLHKRSRHMPVESDVLKIADLELNLTTKMVKRGSKKIDLTAREMALLEFFLRNQSKALSRNEIAAKVWDVSFDTGTNVVDVYINYLRKKIDKDFTPKLIHTLTGIGYIMKEEE
ncbi:response regulator transcription factor [Rhodocytophaga aerolata]|uniref:Response regulator transcription factor n=1 Tax=Rhodocytophaga aerolata TaxID=455078 RepID=A0ABT8R6B5_9BACT|nr:response regulator transcription factor [Rhodocytophaga aerolata]MDO1447648.1 response regulator transcription factor [Rhodocytophaga aerolata]